MSKEEKLSQVQQLSQEEKKNIPTHESNEKVVPTGSNEASVGFSGNAASEEDVSVKKPQAIDSAEEIPSWEKIGWKRVAELGDTRDTRADKKSQYDEILKELYYSDLWAYSSVVFVSLFTTWFIVLCGGGLGWILVLCAFVATYLKNSATRFYRNAKSDLYREIAKDKLVDDDEKVEWLNEFLRRFWLIYEPVLSTTIIQIADGILVASTPSFLDSLRLSTFTLGTKPPIIESIKSYPRTADDELIMDWRVSFVPNDLADMTKAQLAKKVNPKVVLTARVGRGIVGAGIPILVEDMSFTGIMKVKLKLIPNFPHVEFIELSFVEPPVFDYVLKPIGGETLGFDIGIVPGLTKFVRDQVHATLKPMMYAPNSYKLETKYLLYGYPIESAIGVLKLVIKNAKSLRNAETFGTSDPYCKVLLESIDATIPGKEITRTKHIDNSLSPVWDDTRYLLFNNLKDSLKFLLCDSNGKLSTDTVLGECIYRLHTFSENPNRSNSTLPVMHGGNQKGELNFDAIWYPASEVKDDEPLESNTGILKVNIHQAKTLDPKFSMVGVYNPYAELTYNGNHVFRTKTHRRTNNPIWEEFFEIFVTDRKGSKLSLNIHDERDFAEDPVVGSWSMSVDQFLGGLNKSKIDWFDVKNARSGKVRLSCQWKPIKLDHVPENRGSAKPIGIVKLHIKKATNLKNVERLLGKSDPYIRVSLESTYRGRTETRDNNLNPTWDEFFYIPVHSLGEKILLQCFDHEDRGQDRSLGFTDFEVKTLVKDSDNGKFSPAESIDTAAPLKEAKGSLFYSASFYPVEGEEENITNVLKYKSGILIVNIKEASIKKNDTYVDVFVNNDDFPVYSTRVSDKPNWDEETDIFINELDSSKIIFNINQSNSKSKETIEVDVKELLEKHLKDNENIQLPIEGMNHGALTIGISYIPVKYGNAVESAGESAVESESAVEPSHKKIDDARQSHPEPEPSHKKEHTSTTKIFNDLGGGVSSLLKKKDKHKNEETIPKEEPKVEELKEGRIAPEEIRQTNANQEKVKEEPIPKPTENHVEVPQEEKQNQVKQVEEETKPYTIKDNSKQEEEIRTREISFESSLPREGSSSSEENVNNRNSGDIVSEPGTLTLTVMGAKNLTPSNSYVKVKKNHKRDILKTSAIKKSTNPEWNEEVTLSLTGEPVSFLFCVQDKNLLSKDVELGDCELNLWDHIKPNEHTKDFWVDLSKGNSQLHIKLNFVPKSNSNEQERQVNGNNSKRMSRYSSDNDREVHDGNGNGKISLFGRKKK